LNVINQLKLKMIYKTSEILQSLILIVFGLILFKLTVIARIGGTFAGIVVIIIYFCFGIGIYGIFKSLIKQFIKQSYSFASNFFKKNKKIESKLNDNTQKKADQGDISKNAQIIEKTLDSFGLRTRVVEVNKEKDYIEYCLQVTAGLNLDELEKHSRVLALALASPTGKVKMIIPIPGRALVGIQVPNPTKEELEKRQRLKEVKDKSNNTLRKKIGNVVLFIAYLIAALGERIKKE